MAYSRVVGRGWLIEQLLEFSMLSQQVSELWQDSEHAERDAHRRWRVDGAKAAQGKASAAEARALFEELRAREPTVNAILEVMGLPPVNLGGVERVQCGFGDPSYLALLYVKDIDDARNKGGRSKLADYLSLLDRCQRMALKDAAAARADPVWAELRHREPETKEILSHLHGDLTDCDFDFDDADGLIQVRDALVQGLAIFDGLDELNREMSSRTSESPVLATDQLHPWIWDAAGALCDIGAYRAAIQAAATAVNGHAQEKLDRRDVADVKLMQEAFSDDPPERGKPRLRCPGDAADSTVKSRQRGALQYAAGCFLAIRNPASHAHREWDRQVALESLASLSLLARWIDDWELDTVP
jgi:hypothetical protein